ncbi:30S ribosomal protein S13 [Candidatus Woesearchaeota archaeon]|jgi:small subunit ribosomal protein S13|nr:30S ribosomal protein S13 [Candidatus Woesearchaeota archaeon]MBT4151382.1 30S ribosomal protein S13 [Candidatus Woesearchaeota archaeon]MBT4247780.1 30S ribosomal protein S13 [Candidatus Woesearchaeota archaeon]MBT4434204.1 30S ribosomal protein S13 [Candidatus Woesearchaeota archaeon]
MVENQNNFKHIVRVANVDVPGEKAVKIALTKIKGVGMQFAGIVCTLANVEKNQKVGNLSDTEIQKLNEIVKNPQSAGMPVWMLNRRKDYETGENKHILTGDLVFTQDNDLKRLKKIKSLRGVRHGKKLPVRGQRTRSNFRKTKGKVVGVKRKGK